MRHRRIITFARIALGSLRSLTVLGDQGAWIAEEVKEVNLEEEVLASWRRKEKKSLLNYTEVTLYFVSGFFFLFKCALKDPEK